MLDITGLFDESLEAIRTSKYDRNSSKKDFNLDDTQIKDSRRHFKIILNNHPPKYSPSIDFIYHDDHEFEKLIKFDNNVPFDCGPGNFDVIICVGEEPNMEKFRSHSVILSKRSSYFRTALSSTWAKKCGNVFFFEKPNMSPKVFTSILRYLYIGKIKLKRLDIKTLLDIMIASDELVLQELSDQIQNHLICLPTNLFIPYLISFIITCYNNPSFEKLLHHIIKILYQDPSLLFIHHDLSLLQQSILIWILEEIHHLLDDEDIWGCIINWGIGQHSNLMNININDWKKHEFSILNETVYPLLKFIRFSHISRNYYIEHMIPYLSYFKEINNDTIRYYLNTFNIESQQSFLISLHDSILINHSHIFSIANWIDKGKTIISPPKPKKQSNRFSFPFFKRRNNSKINPPSPSKKIHYTFDLLFRMSRDGPSVYHDRCFKQGPTLVIAKIRCPSKTIIVGGYNPVGFNYSFNIDLSSLSQTFIFSFGDGEGLEKLSMIRVQTDWSRMAIKFSTVGLCFGYDDLTINFKERSCEFSKYFFKFVEYDTSELVECEVFQVLES